MEPAISAGLIATGVFIGICLTLAVVSWIAIESVIGFINHF